MIALIRAYEYTRLAGIPSADKYRINPRDGRAPRLDRGGRALLFAAGGALPGPRGDATSEVGEA